MLKRCCLTGSRTFLPRGEIGNAGITRPSKLEKYSITLTRPLENGIRIKVEYRTYRMKSVASLATRSLGAKEKQTYARLRNQ